MRKKTEGVDYSARARASVNRRGGISARGFLLLAALLVLPGIAGAGSQSEAEAEAWVLELDDSRPETRRAAEKKLLKAGRDAVRAVTARAQDELRFSAMSQLLAVLGYKAIPRLIELAADRELGGTAGNLLFRVIDPRSSSSAPELLSCMRSLPQRKHHCGMALVRAMGPKGKGQAGLLRSALKDLDPMVRAYAAGALGEIGPQAKAAVAELVEALGDPNALVRLGAAGALGKIGRKASDAVPALEAALQDADGEVRSAADEALGKIRG